MDLLSPRFLVRARRPRPASLAGLLATLLTLTACAPPGTATSAGRPGPQGDAFGGDSAAAEAAPSPARVASERLVDAADAERRDGDLGSAASLLERAVRIDPSNGRAYLELAFVRSAQDRRDEALGLVERALELLPFGSPGRSRAEALRERLGGA